MSKSAHQNLFGMQNRFKDLLITPFALIFAYFAWMERFCGSNCGGLKAVPQQALGARIGALHPRLPMRIIGPCPGQAGPPNSGWKIKRIASTAALRFGLHTPVAKA
jgi:hypothetical protein